MNKRSLFAVAALAAGLCAGCVLTSHHAVGGGVVATKGVVIRAEDDSFIFFTNKRFTTPFQVNFCEAPEPSGWRRAESLGAVRVQVTHPGSIDPLHGVLVLCRVHESARGAASRSYYIQIPQSVVDDTSEGRISLAYEPSGADPPWDVPSWILWLSREPFAP